MASPAMADSRPARPALSEALTLLAFCGFLFFFGLGAIGLVGADEPRYAQIAREMLARHDWVTPVLNGKPWLEKPALYYWEAMLSYRLFGVSDWAARIPAAFSATTMAAAIYLVFAFVIRRRNPGYSHPTLDDLYRSDSPADPARPVLNPLDAALMTVSSAAMIGFGRGASTDMLMAANFSIAMLCWLAGYLRRQRRWLFGFYAFLALATLAKGPVAPALAVLILALTAAMQLDLAILRWTVYWPAIALYFAVTTPWYWLVQARTGTFFRVFFLQHNLERFGTNLFRHPQPFWYYLPVTLLALLPWTVWCCLACWRGLKRLTPVTRLYSVRKDHYTKFVDPSPAQAADFLDHDVLPRFLVVWAIVPVVFFSFSQSKLPGYILPAVPAWTLLAAFVLERESERHARPGRVAILLHAAVSAALVGAAVVSPYLVLKIPVARTAVVVAGAAALAIVIGLLVTLRRGLGMLRFSTLVPVVIALGYVLRIAAPAVDLTQSARPVALELARIESQPARIAVLHVKRETEYGLNFYRNQEIFSYDRAEIPPEDHLVVARRGSESELNELAGGRRVVRLGQFPAQGLEFFWITRATAHAAELPR